MDRMLDNIRDHVKWEKAPSTMRSKIQSSAKRIKHNQEKIANPLEPDILLPMDAEKKKESD